MNKKNINGDVIVKAVQKYAFEKGIGSQNIDEILRCADIYRDKIAALSAQDILLLKEALGQDEVRHLESILNEVK